MPELRHVHKSRDPIIIQESTDDESANLLELRNKAGTTVYSIDRTGASTFGSVAAAINMKQSGVIGNGIVNDYTSIQNIVNNAPVGSTFAFPASSYTNTTQPISLPTGSTVVGSPGATLTGYGFKVNNKVQILGMQFTGDLSNNLHGVTHETVGTFVRDVKIDQCLFTNFAQAIYLDRTTDNSQAERWQITNNTFSGCVAGVFAIRANYILIDGNDFPTAQNTAQSIIFWGGNHNRIVNNSITYGKTGILFLYHRSFNGNLGLIYGNIITNNIVQGCSEEHISLDINGNTAADVAVFEKDTVASKTGTTVTLTNAGWSSAGNAYAGYYLIFNTGALAGQIFPITSQSNAVFTPVISSAQIALIVVGDNVVIGAPMFGNVVSGNFVDASARGTTASIALYGLCYGNTVSDNQCFGKPLMVSGLNSLIKASPNFTNTFGMAPSESNIITGNTLNQCDILLEYHDFGVSPTFDNHNNKVDNLNVLMGGTVIKQRQV